MAQTPTYRMIAMFLLCFTLLQPALSQQAQPVLSRSKDSTVATALGNEAAIQDQAAARQTTVGQHSVLKPYEQCGGEMGLCNRTTIGVPCGDHPWGVECPRGYACLRKTAAMWQCNPVVGKQDSADEGPTRFTTAPKGSEADSQAIDQSQIGLQPPGGGADALGNTPQGAGASGDVTPSVKGCAPGQFSVGNRCFKSSAGSSNLKAASSVLLLAAGQLAVVLGALALLSG